jgi:hypothetical protein
LGITGPITREGKGTYGLILGIIHNKKKIACKVIHKQNQKIVRIPKEVLKEEISNEITTMEALSGCPNVSKLH